MFFSRRGSITVFVCIVLAALVPLCCILMDLSRYSMAKKQAETALKTCAESMLAAYDRQLRDQYGLFALYPRETETMEEEIYELLSQNLNAGASVEGVSDLYGFKVRKVEVIPLYNLSEPFVLQQQAAEFMKYRGPVQVVQEFYEKIKVMMGLMKEAELVEQKMSLDKLMNGIRSSLVNIYHMLNEKLISFNISKYPEIALKDSTFDTINSLILSAAKEVENANAEVEPIKGVQNNYISLYPEYKIARDNYNFARDTLNSVISGLESKEAELRKAKDELTNATGSNASGSAPQALKDKVIDLEGNVADLGVEYAHADSSYQQAIRLFESLESEIIPFKSELDKSLGKVIASLIFAIKNNKSSSLELNVFLKHVVKHAQYHTDLIAIIDALAPQLDDLHKQSSALHKDTQNNDSSVSDRIKGDLDKQLKSIDKETFTEIRIQLSKNLQGLEYWKQAITEYLSTIDQVSADLDYVLKSAVTVRDEPQNGDKHYLGYGGYGNATTGLNILASSLIELKTLAEMKGTYSVPIYALEPQSINKEYDAFQKWFYKKYYALDSKTPPPPSDDTELKQIRESVGIFAEDVGQQGGEEQTLSTGQSEKDHEPDQNGIGYQEQDQNQELGLLERMARRLKLPSKQGAISSDDALRRIGEVIEESDINELINESPFDKPVEGLGLVNENDKNFFDYEITRIAELINIIRNAVSNGVEGIIESLYMNEYIVSAFKCATSDGNIEHDIGWGRPLESTYFKNGEVEYIIFGKFKETENIGCAQRSVFAMRLMFNLLHVYTDSDKLATTLSLATSVAGWTIFGVPVVQNFLLISWAGLESYIDSEILIKGERVPLIKTSSSWYLEVDNMADSLKNIFLKNIKEFAEDQIEMKINDASETIQETVTGIIDSKIDEAFARFEKGLDQVVVNASEAIQQEVVTLVGSDLLSAINFENMDSFAEGLGKVVNEFVRSFSDKLGSFGQEKLAQFKSSLKERIKALIFDSSLYVGLVDKVKSVANDLLNKGINAVGGKIDNAFGPAGKSRSNNIAGRLITMDYLDYLRLMLLAVPIEKKALRTADLMQLNMQEVSKNYDLSISQYKTYLFIKVEIDMSFWFLPEKLYRKQDAGMISIEWSQGY